MKKGKKEKIKKAAHGWVPQSQNEVADAIKQVGDTSREIERLSANMNDEIAVITAKYQPEIDAHEERLDSLQKGVQTYCEANRDKLTHGGKTKTVNFITGNVSWRQRPPKCTIRGEENVIEMLKKFQLSRFIRQKEEINKEAILSEPGAVSGISGISVVTGVEDFAIEPFEQQT